VEDEHIRIGVPPAVNTSFQGTAQAFSTSLSSEPYRILASGDRVYIVLGILYESMTHSDHHSLHAARQVSVLCWP